jgi:DNA-binding NtrC family response regulator
VGKHIFVFEPSRVIRKILEVHLQLVGHQVRTFATYGLAGGALPLFQREPPHLAFVALHSSQPESYNLLKQVRTHYLDVALVALVMPEERGHRSIQTMLQEARAVTLIKPFKIEMRWRSAVLLP